MSPQVLTREEAQRIYEVNTYVLNHFGDHFTVRQLARKAALGERKFREGFYYLNGRTVGDYIHEARIRTGKFLLVHTDKSIKEIALLCGYSKTRNFSSAYRKFFGVSPIGERQEAGSQR